MAQRRKSYGKAAAVGENGELERRRDPASQAGSAGAQGFLVRRGADPLVKKKRGGPGVPSTFRSATRTRFRAQSFRRHGGAFPTRRAPTKSWWPSPSPIQAAPPRVGGSKKDEIKGDDGLVNRPNGPVDAFVWSDFAVLLAAAEGRHVCWKPRA